MPRFQVSTITAAVLLAAFSLPCALHAEPPPEVNVTIKTKVAQMRYDKEIIQAQPGAKVTITLDNEDDLPHNLIVCREKEDGPQDKGMEVAQAAWALAEHGMAKQWIPDHPRIIAASKMVDPHQKDTFSFLAPEQEGKHPFVCTFPGHALVMNGILEVAKPIPPIRNLHFRYYTGSFKKLPDFSKLPPQKGGPLPAGKCDINLFAEKNNFAYEFEGFLDAPKDGEYRFELGGDDGVRLLIDDKVVLEDDEIRPFRVKNSKVKLTKGEHRIRAQYFEAAGEELFYLAWSGPGFRTTPLSEWVPDEKAKGEEDATGIPILVKDEAVIYRNFIRDTSPRGIAVGYPGGVNICWDADQMNLALVWQGAFIDAKRHWTGRGTGQQPPLGYGVGRHPLRPSLTVLDRPDAPWPGSFSSEQYQNADYRFLGYELDARRQPTFRWKFKNVLVTETFTPAGDFKNHTATLTRTVKFECAEAPPASLYFRALSGNLEPQNDGGWMLDREISVSASGGTRVERSDGKEVVFPVIFKDGKAEISTKYSWTTKLTQHP